MFGLDQGRVQWQDFVVMVLDWEFHEHFNNHQIVQWI
jgi:hypothetical protein